MSRANIAAWVDGGLVHTCAARVEAWNGEPSHYEINEEGDVIIHCKLHRAGTPVKANLGPMCAAQGAGVWLIPDVGTEVVLGSDHGDFEGELYLLAMHPTSKNPGGLAPGKVLVIGDVVEVRSFGGAAQRSSRFEDYRAAEDRLVTANGTFATAIGTFIAAQAVYNAAVGVLLGPPAAAAAGVVATAASVFAGTLVTFETAIATFEAGAETYLARVLKNE